MDNSRAGMVRIAILYAIALALGAVAGWWLNLLLPLANALILVVLGALLALQNLIVKSVFADFSAQVARFSDMAPATGRTLAAYLGRKRRELYIAWALANAASAVSVVAGGWLYLGPPLASDDRRWLLMVCYSLCAAALPGLARTIHYGQSVDRFAVQVTELIQEPQRRAERLKTLGRAEGVAATAGRR